MIPTATRNEEGMSNGNSATGFHLELRPPSDFGSLPRTTKPVNVYAFSGWVWHLMVKDVATKDPLDPFSWVGRGSRG